jgi:hypothetical protein
MAMMATTIISSISVKPDCMGLRMGGFPLDTG